MRVPVLAQARATAMVELSRAHRIIHHTPPQTRFDTTMAGSSDDPGKEPILAVPQPMMIAQVTRIRYTPRMMMEPITARGTLRSEDHTSELQSRQYLVC